MSTDLRTASRFALSARRGGALLVVIGAGAAALIAHIGVDVIGDYLLPHDTYDNIGHTSRTAVSCLALLGIATSAFTLVQAALDDARRASGSGGFRGRSAALEPGLPRVRCDRDFRDARGDGTRRLATCRNTKAPPPYNYSELRAGVGVGPGLFSVTLTNVFKQWANIQGLRNVGVPLAAFVTLAAAPTRIAWTADLVHSRAQFTVSHMVLSKVWGHVPIRSITLETTASSVVPTQIDALLDVTHEDTDNHDRDSNLRSETYFDVAHYPTMAFHSTKIAPTGPDDATVTGDVTIKNFTKSVTFPIHVVGRIPDSAGTRVGYIGELHIDRRDFGMVDNRLTPAGVLFVGYDVTIGLSVEATTPQTSFLHDATAAESTAK